MMTMREYTVDAIAILNSVSIQTWSEVFVNLKMEFHRLYCRGLITSIIHGPNWFDNVLRCLDGEEWSKKEYAGQYEDNFRKIIEFGRKETKT